MEEEGRWKWKYKGEGGEEGLREDCLTQYGLISDRRYCLVSGKEVYDRAT